MTSNLPGLLATLSGLALAATAALAQTPAGVQATDPWVRATVPQQKATGLFVTLQSAQGARLVAASSPVAEVVEIHEMLMEQNVMKMRSVRGVDLPKGQAVSLKPGGLHVMLMGLKQQVKEGDTVPVQLVLEGADGQRHTLTVQAQGRALKAGGGGHAH